MIGTIIAIYMYKLVVIKNDFSDLSTVTAV